MIFRYITFQSSKKLRFLPLFAPIFGVLCSSWVKMFPLIIKVAKKDIFLLDIFKENSRIVLESDSIALSDAIAKLLKSPIPVYR